MKKILVVFMILAVCLGAYAGGSSASPAANTSGEWKPERPVTIIVGMGPGGGIDVMARILAPTMQEVLGVPVIVENMPGSSSGIAAEYIMKNPPDGLRLFATSSSICVFPATENADVTYHDLDMLVMPFTTFNPAIIVRKNSGITNMAQFIQMLKTRPTTASTTVVGSSWHITGAVVANTLGALQNVTWVPYSGGGDCPVAVAKGEVDWTACGIFQESGPVLREGLADALSVISREPFNMAGYGEVRSILETVPELEPYVDILAGFRAFAVHKDTPANIRTVLVKALDTAIKSEPFQRMLADNGVADAPLLWGADAQELFERTTRSYSWLLYDMGDAPRNPNTLNVPRLP